MAVQQLGEIVVASLFDRITRMVTLIYEGQDLIPTAERLIWDFDLANKGVRAAAARR